MMMQEPHVGGPGRLILATTIISVTCATFVGSINVGMLTIAIPSVAEDVGLDSSLLLWPQSISSLVCACTLLLFGSLADAFGSHRVYLLGIVLQTAFTLGTALVHTSTQLLVCRALAGLAQAAILPSSVGLIVRTCPEGRMRNIAFASMGSGQPLGFSIGLVMAGGLIESLGWRSGFYVAAGINLFVCVLALFSLAGPARAAPVDWQSLKGSIDWAGTMVMTTLLALVSYVLTIITAEGWSASYKANITMLCIAAVLGPVFVWWQDRQVRLGRPALIPNSLWRQTKFSCICASVLLIWGAFNSFEQFMSLWFQLVDEVSLLDTSLRFLPQPVAGAAIGFSIGFLVHRVRANYIILISTVVSTAAPLLMALASPKQSYWSAAFPALTLNAIGADCLYSVSNLIISSLFEPNMQGAAGGVFNTVAQVGKTLGLAIGTLIAGAVSSKISQDLEESQRLVKGYQAAFWFCMALCGVSVVICSWGLRSVGKVGLKKN